MGKQFKRHSFDSFTENLIRTEAARIVRGARLRDDEREDLEQDLRLHLVKRTRQYDAERGRPTTFAKCVVTRQACALLSASRAQRRSRGREAYSLDEVQPGGHEPRIDHIDQDTYLRATGRRPDQLDLSLDVKRAMGKLGDGERELAQLLMEDRMADIARRTGIPRSSLYDRVARLRASLEAAGLGAYRKRKRRRFTSESSR